MKLENSIELSPCQSPWARRGPGRLSPGSPAWARSAPALADCVSAPCSAPTAGTWQPRSPRAPRRRPCPRPAAAPAHRSQSWRTNNYFMWGFYFVVENGLLSTLTAKIVKTEAVLLFVLVSVSGLLFIKPAWILIAFFKVIVLVFAESP